MNHLPQSYGSTDADRTWLTLAVQEMAMSLLCPRAMRRDTFGMVLQ